MRLYGIFFSWLYVSRSDILARKVFCVGSYMKIDKNRWRNSHQVETSLLSFSLFHSSLKANIQHKNVSINSALWLTPYIQFRWEEKEATSIDHTQEIILLTAFLLFAPFFFHSRSSHLKTNLEIWLVYLNKICQYFILFILSKFCVRNIANLCFLNIFHGDENKWRHAYNTEDSVWRKFWGIWQNCVTHCGSFKLRISAKRFSILCIALW